MMKKMAVLIAVVFLTGSFVFADIQKADRLFNERNWEEAAAEYRKAVETLEGSAAIRAQWRLGRSLFNHEKYEEAIEELRKIKEIADIAPIYIWQAQDLIAVMLEQQGKRDEAIAELRKVQDVENMPNAALSRTYIRMADFLRREEKYDEALAELEKAKKVEDVSMVDVTFRKGSIFLDKGQPEEAESEFKSLLNMGSLSFHMLRIALRNINDLSGMADAFVLQLKEGDERNRALVMEKASENPELCKEIIKAMPDDKEVVKALSPHAEKKEGLE